MINEPIKSDRICLMDEVRGFAVFCMVFYHGFFLLGSNFGLEYGRILFQFFEPVQPLFAATFIFISGISCRLSRNNLKRGAKLFCISVAISVITVVFCPLIGINGAEIYFGILHFLSVSMLLFALAEKFFDKIKPQWGILVCAVLYAFTSGIGDGKLAFGNLVVIDLPNVLYNYDFLFPLGIHSSTFYSADYFGFLPNIFMFLAGAYTGIYIKLGLCPRWAYQSRCRFFAWLGRHALIVYVAHQPIIFALAYVIGKISSLF